MFRNISSMNEKRPKIVLFILGFLGVLLVAFMVYWVIYLRKAHSTFENYYAFRGCIELIKKTDDYGLCKIKSGETIKIVKYNGRWYLDGDLPTCWLHICF